MHYSSRPAWRNQWGLMLLAALAFVASLAALAVAGGLVAGPGETGTVILLLTPVLLVVVLLTLLYRHYMWRFVVSETSIESHRGIIGRHVKYIRIRDLRNINLNQSLFQRIFGVGDLEFSSSGGGGIEVTFFGITDPQTVRELVQRLQGES